MYVHIACMLCIKSFKKYAFEVKCAHTFWFFVVFIKSPFLVVFFILETIKKQYNQKHNCAGLENLVLVLSRILELSSS